jgi:hypothetical protein
MRDETKVAEDHQQTQTLKKNHSGDASQGCQQEDAVSKRGKITGKKSRERGKRDEQKQKVYIVHSFSAGLICLFLHLHWWVGLLHILLLSRKSSSGWFFLWIS